MAVRHDEPTGLKFRLAGIPFFDGDEFIEASAEAAFVDEVSMEECVYDFCGDGAPDYASAEADHIHIVVFHALVSGVGFGNQGRFNVRDFIGDDAGANAATADGDTAFHFPIADGNGEGFDAVGVIVLAVVFEGAVIGEVNMRDILDYLLQFFFECEAAVVGGDTNFHGWVHLVERMRRYGKERRTVLLSCMYMSVKAQLVKS